MANNLVKGKNDARLLQRVLAKKHGNKNTLMQRLWYSNGAPAVDAGSQATLPVALGDIAFDYTNNDVYIATVAPAAGTAATFTKIID